MDRVPGTVTYFWLTPTTAGTYEILCFELCGSGHYAMRGTVVVDEEADYQAWLQEQSTFAELYARAASGATESTELAVDETGPAKTSISVRSEEHTSELQSLMRISYAVFCLKKKNKDKHTK